MARADKKNPWDAAFRRIRCVYDATYWHPPKPKAPDLDAVGAQLGIGFPQSYRAFAQEFGLDGRLESLPELLPMTPPDRSWAYTSAGLGEYRPEQDYGSSVVTATRFMRADALDWSDLTEAAPAGLFERLVVFASDEGQETFVFDPADVTEKRWRECRIYSIGRSFDTGVIASSFTEWLYWIEENYRFDRNHPDEGKSRQPFPSVYKPASPEPYRMLFHPNVVRPKTAPAAPDVQRWLARNDGAVLGLARALRDERRHDLFAVLADALEEAGCDSDDLLTACRAGDPDVDGAWALAVLLGSPPLSPAG